MNVTSLIANRFELGEFIAQGGMGAVYRGRDVQTGQPVAIKRLKEDLLNADPTALPRFVREGEMLRTLNHRNIVKLLAAVEHEGSHYLILEYVGGGSLANILLKTPRLPISEVLRIALETADALAQAHHLKIIHRDIKPGNILLAEDGTPRLSDFGIARVSTDLRLTQAGALVGTLAYLPPEAFSGTTPTARGDIWAFGVMLYEMLAGELPFPSRHTGILINEVLNQPTPDLEARRPDAPAALIDLVYRMLDKNPRQRIGRMRQIAAELEAILDAVPSAVATRQIAVGIDPSARPAADNVMLDTQLDTHDSYDTIQISPSQAAVPRSPHNLPAQTSIFVGRETELGELAGFLAEPTIRLITILGPGGMGKTRLALETASTHKANFPDGVYFIALAPVTDPLLIESTVAEAIGFQFYQAESSPKQQLLNYLHEKTMLLIFDNFEHILSGAPLVTDILQMAANVKIIATSRERLNLDGETLFRVEGMSFPDWDSLEAAAENSAVKLFLQGVRQVQPSFALTADHLKPLARICRQVEGLPLGILLAASWISSLTLPEIADEIGRSLDFLETERRDVPVRQRSIRAVFDYSWGLLTADEQLVFAKLSIFRGGFMREVAQTITGASLKVLASLTNKSLLRRDPGGRYDIHELLRQYAELKLIAMPDVQTALRDQHTNYYAEFVGSREARLFSRDQLQVIPELESELSNLRLAVERAIETRNNHALEQIRLGLVFFLEVRGLNREWVPLLKQALDKVPKSDNDLAAALGHWMLGALASISDDDPLAQASLAYCLPIFRSQLRDREIANTLYYLAIYANTAEERNAMLATTRDIYRKLGDQRPADRWYLAQTLRLIANELGASGDDQAIETLLEEAKMISEALGESYLETWVFRALAIHKQAGNDLTFAQRYFERSLQAIKKLNSPNGLMISLAYVANNEAKLSAYSEADAHAMQALELARKSGSPSLIAFAYQALASNAYMQGHEAEAKIYLQDTLRYSRDTGDIRAIANNLNNLGHPTAALGQYSEAERYFREALTLLITMDTTIDKLYKLESLIGLADLFSQHPAAENRSRAAELLSFASEHPATTDALDPLIEPIWKRLKVEFTADMITSVQAHGNNVTLYKVIADILAMPPIY